MDKGTTFVDVGAGLRLRPWQASDLHALLLHADDEQVSRGVSDRFPYPYTREDGEAFLSGRVVDFSHPVFAIELHGEACGGIGALPSLDLQRLQATVLDFNAGSARVLEKNGFVEEGVLRNAVRKRGRLHDLRMFARLRDSRA